MIILYLLIIPSIFALIKIILYLIVRKYGKFSYDDFSAAGFAYNAEKDIFYSTKNAWQKNFGYTHLYDVLAPIFNMIIDTEPVRFYYNNKNWLITFWKGQYGIVTGAEVGIYCTKQKEVDKKTVYLPVDNNEMLDMDLILYENGEEITRVSTRHWWLAIFKLGMLSNPKELSMDVNITFPNAEMLEAFLKSFKKLGYKDKHFKVIDKTFCFKYTKPRANKVWTRTWISDGIRQFFNRKNSGLYNKYLLDLIDDNRVDDSKIPSDRKLIMVNKFVPEVLKNPEENDEYSRRIMKDIFNKTEKNIIFLDSDCNIYSESKVNNNAQ